VKDDIERVRRSSAAQGLVRVREGRVVAGVLAGLARRFGVTPAFARILFLLSLLLPGPQFIAYLVLWVLMPEEQSA
jgi:phage shock protein PspC (stress-responsive transcriptional regulator)